MALWACLNVMGGSSGGGYDVSVFPSLSLLHTQLFSLFPASHLRMVKYFEE